MDYAPGQRVTITGSGWQPGETVTLLLRENPAIDPDVTISVVADAAGNTLNTDFVPDANDVGVRFLLTATGRSSGNTAQTIFSDAPGGVTITTSTLANWDANHAGYSQTVTATGGTGAKTFAVTAGSTPTGLTLSTSGVLSGTPTAAGSFTFTVTATDTVGGSASQTYTVTIDP